ncbi:MAG: ribbon-helix-helix protein, CopG family [Promethearchaeota archaeon]|nr:MAG: ribbon-helix-helix protein, CopG family [Candidatus Lokiarchaeota archaeon]
MQLITLHLPQTYLEGIEELVKDRIYPNRSELIRVAVRDLLKSELWSRNIRKD